jgi:hypothetical protein
MVPQMDALFIIRNLHKTFAALAVGTRRPLGEAR